MLSLRCRGQWEGWGEKSVAGEAGWVKRGTMRRGRGTCGASPLECGHADGNGWGTATQKKTRGLKGFAGLNGGLEVESLGGPHLGGVFLLD